MYALVDANSFYASCEQVFRPDWRGKPVVVLSNNDGCIVARNKEAKKLDIPNIAAYFKLRTYLQRHKVKVTSSNYALYGDISYRMMETLRRFTPDLEVYSIDEAFLGLSGFNTDLLGYGHQIRHTIWQHVRVPVSVGIAPTKTLAKVANHMAKKSSASGVCLLDKNSNLEEVLCDLPTQKVWGIGHRLAVRLSRHKINSALDLAKANPNLLRRIGNVCLERTASELKGTTCLEPEDITHKKQIYSTRSFGIKVSDLQSLYEAISLYATRACEKLRAEQQQVKTIHVFLHTSPYLKNYYSNSVTVQLPHATDDSRMVIQCAKVGIRRIFAENKAYLKCGIGLIELIDKSQQQGDLFSRGQSKKSSQLVSAIDNINQRFGAGTAFFAAQGVKKPWQMRQEFKSPSYTTRWQDIPVVR